MLTVDVNEARTSLADLLDEVAKGETITITRDGVAVATLAPTEETRRRRTDDTIAALREFGKGKSLGGSTIRELVEEGRRY